LMQQERANRRFNQVRQLANRFLFDFHDEIAKVAGTVKAREMIVSTALEYLNSLSADAVGDPGLQWELAVAYGKVASAQGSTTSPSLMKQRDAHVSWDKAFSLLRPLDDRKQITIPQRESFVKLLSQAAEMNRGERDFASALQLDREAMRRSEGLPPATRRFVMQGLASTLGRSGDLSGSVKLGEEMIPLLRTELQSSPSYRTEMRLANSLTNLGYFQSLLTRFSEAEANEKEALAIIRKNAQERADPKFSALLCNALYFLALTEGASDRPSLGRYKAAAALVEEALAQYDTRITADPRDNQARRDASLARTGLASILNEIAPKEALQHAEIGIGLIDAAAPSDFENRVQARIIAASTYLRLGRLRQAERLLNEAGRLLAKDADSDPEYLMALARLESARGNAAEAINRFERAISLNEARYMAAATPANAWSIARVLNLAAVAHPESENSRSARILAVWQDQNRRFPGLHYIEEQIADARERLRSQQ
jgi:tetratricopeptide (TPR) repeat protein